jgi:hypothetical protein
VRRGLLILAGLVSLLGAPSGAHAAVCDLPDAAPWWIDFADGTVPFRAQFARPGVIVATNGSLGGPLRAAGAQTVYWEMHLEQYIGTPTAPAPQEKVGAAADILFSRAAASSGCGTPVIALNEMLGVAAPAPLPDLALQYRANLVSFIQELDSRGAVPFLLLPSSPNTTGADASWWAQLGQYAHLVREVYPSAPNVLASGLFGASRQLRVALRTAVQNLTAMGVPGSQIGLMLGFQSGGRAGRTGLEPLASWLEYVKLATLSANAVASEQQIGSVWVWGWGTYSAAGGDGDKAVAACVELWARDPSFCDAPSRAAFDTDLSAGQLASIPAGAQCLVAGVPLSQGQLEAATSLLGSPSAALTALFSRAALTPLVPVSRFEERAAERTLVLSPTRLLAAAQASGVTVGFLRGVIVDQLRFSHLTTEQVFAAQNQALASTVCRDDVLPAVGDVRLAPSLPLLRGASLGLPSGG